MKRWTRRRKLEVLDLIDRGYDAAKIYGISEEELAQWRKGGLKASQDRVTKPQRWVPPGAVKHFDI